MQNQRFEKIDNKDLIPISVTLPGSLPATATNYEIFFKALRAYEVMEIGKVQRVAGSDAGAVTLNIERLSSTGALDAGDEICVSAFNLKSTTDVTKKTTDLKNRALGVGDRLALKDSGTLTAVAGLTVTILLKPRGKGDYR